MYQENFDLEKLLKMNTDNIIVRKRNEPNIEKMAEAFFKLLIK